MLSLSLYYLYHNPCYFTGLVEHRGTTIYFKFICIGKRKTTYPSHFLLQRKIDTILGWFAWSENAFILEALVSHLFSIEYVYIDPHSYIIQETKIRLTLNTLGF